MKCVGNQWHVYFAKRKNKFHPFAEALKKSMLVFEIDRSPQRLGALVDATLLRPHQEEMAMVTMGMEIEALAGRTESDFVTSSGFWMAEMVNTPCFFNG